jgi:microcystin-dependent protein
VNTVTILPQTMPAHTHTLNATTTQGTTATIGNTVLPGTPPAGSGNEFFYANQPTGSPALTYHTLAGGVVSMAGGSQPHANLMPSLCITFVIALVGIFPTRS